MQKRPKKTFADIKVRMVMRIYGVTRAKAEKIISERSAAKAEASLTSDPDRGEGGICSDDDDLMSAEEFFGSSCMTVGGFPLQKFAWPLFYGLLSRSSGPRYFD